tara:strand:+ start:160 stop:837 length:678 start_codon:yes stop_codon:yes gene_type:complete
MQTLERADIESITFGGHDCGVTQVRGYQNYDMSDLEVMPIRNPTAKRPWVDTAVKSVDFERVFFDIHPNSYADFGCNLGYYVFKVAQEFDIPATGVDYNKEYIGICESVKARHTAALATFKHTNLEQWSLDSDTYEFMTVFNVIHHLYNRTEKYMDMGKLLRDFADKADTILFEVPTEQDKKGHKWTMDTGYSEALFVSSAETLFTSVKRMPGQTEHRPYYLCSK